MAATIWVSSSQSGWRRRSWSSCRTGTQFRSSPIHLALTESDRDGRDDATTGLDRLHHGLEVGRPIGPHPEGVVMAFDSSPTDHDRHLAGQHTPSPEDHVPTGLQRLLAHDAEAHAFQGKMAPESPLELVHWEVRAHFDRVVSTEPERVGGHGQIDEMPFTRGPPHHH